MSDYLFFEKKIIKSSSDVILKNKIRAVLKEIEPQLIESYEKSEFPMSILPKLSNLNIIGGLLKNYGCPGLSKNEFIIVLLEISKVDLSLATFIGVQVSLVMETIYNLGSETQKNHYLPKLANLDLPLDGPPPTIFCDVLSKPKRVTPSTIEAAGRSSLPLKGRFVR